VIIHRAFYREAVQTTIAIVAVLVVVLVLFGLTAALGRTARGVYTETIVLRLIGWQTLRYLDLLVPLGFYLGVLLTFSRWYRDSEMTVLAACGMGLSQLLRPVLLFAAIFSLLVGGLAFYLTPLATRAIATVRAEGGQRPELVGITPGNFTEAAAGGRMLYAERVDETGRMERIFLNHPHGGRPRVVLAQAGCSFIDAKTGRRFVNLLDGWAYEGTPGQADYRTVRFETYTARLEQRPLVAPPETIEGLRTTALLATDGAEAAGERHWRLSKPLLVLVLAVYGLVLAYTDARRGRLANLFSAILVYFIYSNLLGVAQTMVKRGQVPDVIGLWWVHGLMLAIGLFMFYRRIHHRPILPRLRLALAR
jgi:lipopolysaccharide export system permease protein